MMVLHIFIIGKSKGATFFERKVQLFETNRTFKEGLNTFRFADYM